MDPYALILPLIRTLDPDRAHRLTVDVVNTGRDAFAPFTIFDNDVMVGARLALNDQDERRHHDPAGAAPIGKAEPVTIDWS